jgi:cytochrome c oxidase subunit 2
VAALFAVALLSLLSLDAAYAQSAQPGGITEEAEDMHDLYIVVLVIALAVFVGVEATLVYCIFRFRRRNDELPPQTHGNNVLEVVWTGIPAIIVLVLFSVSFWTLTRVEHTARPQDLSITVTGFQWQWQFDYDLQRLGTRNPINQPGTVTLIGTADNEPTIYIPVGEPVEFKLQANDVIHAFYVPEFLYKLDVVPGRDNRFVVTPTKTGSYDGQCAEFCGTAHAFMRFHLNVVTRDEFDQWIVEQAAAANQSALQP